MPSSPRSPCESTFRWRAVQVVPSPRTNSTFPACSSTNRRPSGANSIAVGLLNPVATAASVNPAGRVVGVHRPSSASNCGSDAPRRRPGARRLVPMTASVLDCRRSPPPRQRHRPRADGLIPRARSRPGAGAGVTPRNGRNYPLSRGADAKPAYIGVIKLRDVGESVDEEPDTGGVEQFKVVFCRGVYRCCRSRPGSWQPPCTTDS